MDISTRISVNFYYLSANSKRAIYHQE